jgi:hypothetical protein
MLISGTVLKLDTLRRKIKSKHKKYYQKILLKRVYKKKFKEFVFKTGQKNTKKEQIPYKTIYQFFDFNLPCPKDIKDCQKYRDLYKNRLDQNIAVFKGCTECSKKLIVSSIIDMLELQH